MRSLYVSPSILNVKQYLYKDGVFLVYLKHMVRHCFDLNTHPMLLGIILLTKDRSGESIPC